MGENDDDFDEKDFEDFYDDDFFTTEKKYKAARSFIEASKEDMHEEE